MLYPNKIYRIYKKNDHFMVIFGCAFQKNLSFKIVMSGLASRARASSQVNLLLYVTFILQWIDFIFGRDEEEDQ